MLGMSISLCHLLNYANYCTMTTSNHWVYRGHLEIDLMLMKVLIQSTMDQKGERNVNDIYNSYDLNTYIFCKDEK